MSLWTAIAEFVMNVPPFAVVYPDEGGVFLRGGKLKQEAKAGWYWKIPFYDKVRKIPIREQVINLATQTMRASNGQSMSFGLTVRYEVADPVKAILHVMNYDDSIQNLAMSTLASYVSRADDLRYDAICKEVLDELSSETEMWGLEISSVGLTDLVEHETLRLITNDVRGELRC